MAVLHIPREMMYLIIVIFTATFCSATTCTDEEFQCQTMDCIPKKWHCDGNDDCDDGSDEIGCPTEPVICDDGELKCKNDICIGEQFWCDNENDCGDNTDEEKCPGLSTKSSHVKEIRVKGNPNQTDTSSANGHKVNMVTFLFQMLFMVIVAWAGVIVA